MKIFESGYYFDVFSLYIKDKKDISEENKYNIKQINPIIENLDWVLNKDLDEEEINELLYKVESKKNKIIQIALEEREEIEKVHGKFVDKINIDTINDIDRNRLKNNILSIEKRATESDIYSLISTPLIKYIELEEGIEILPKEYGGNINIYGELKDGYDTWCIVLSGNKDIKSIIELNQTYYLEGICIPISYINNNKFYKKIKSFTKEDISLTESYYYLDLSVKGKCNLGLQEWPKANKKVIDRYMGNMVLNEDCPYYGRLINIGEKEDIDKGIKIIRDTKKLVKELTCSGVLSTIDNI